MPWNFTAFDYIRAFVDNLPMTHAYCSLREQIDAGFSAIPPIFPDFEDVATAVYNIDVQQRRLALRSHAASKCKPSIYCAECSRLSRPHASFTGGTLLPPYLAFMQTTESHTLALFSSRFNAVLDSACAIHIIRDRRFFWTYHPDPATSVGTASCGVLNTLGCGEVLFPVTLGGDEWTIDMPDCLHAPDVPINLISVGVLQENRIRVVFDFMATTIHFPYISTGVDGLSLSAAVEHRLSFLHCDFLLLPGPSDSPQFSRER